MRAFAVAILLAALGMPSAQVLAQEFNLVIRNHQFEPQELRVPAGKRVSIYVANEDATPEEFESATLKSRKSFPASPKAWCASDRSPPAATSSSASSTRTPPKARSSRNSSMFGALIIVFREVIEAGLIVGIVLAATRGIGGRGYWVAAGVVLGALGACVVALFAEAIANALEGSGQELLNASVLGAAVVMLMWHTVWMARHGREMAAEMVAVGAAVTAGTRPMTALVAVVGLAVLREGSEVVLFLYGILAGGASGSSLFVGGALGLAAGAAFTAFTYYGLVSIPPRHIFAVTTVLIALLAAGMAAQAVQYLDAAGVINVLSRQLWDSSPWLPQDGIVGRVLHTLIGYTDRPTELQLIAYVTTLTAMAALTWLAVPTRARRAPRRSLGTPSTRQR